MKVDINVIDTNLNSKLVSQMSFIFPQPSIESKESQQQQKKIDSKHNSRFNSRYNSTISLKSSIPTKSIPSHTHPFKEDIAMLTVFY